MIAAPADARARPRPQRHPSFGRRGCRRGQDRRLPGPHVRGLATLRIAPEPAPRDETHHAPRDQRHYVGYVLARQPPHRMKPHSAASFAVIGEHAVQDEGVQVDVEIQRPTDALHDHHGPAATIGDVGTAGAA